MATSCSARAALTTSGAASRAPVPSPSRRSRPSSGRRPRACRARAEPGHALALRALGLRPLLGLDLRLGEGTGALLAVPLVASAARALRDVATFDAAGVTQKSG